MIKLKMGCSILSALLVASPLLRAQTTNRPAQSGPAQKLAVFQQRALENPIPEGGILLIGSSTVEIWGKRHAFESSEPLIWHGIGGTTIPFLIQNLDALLLSYKPAKLVIYSGDNDIQNDKGGEKLADKVSDDMIRLASMIRERLPDTHIYILSIKPSIQRASARALQNRANAGIRAMAESQEKVEFVEVGSSLLDDSGNPVPGCFAPDGLHLSAEGYARWNRIISATLTGAL